MMRSEKLKAKSEKLRKVLTLLTSLTILTSLAATAAQYGTLVGGELRHAPRQCVVDDKWIGTAFLAEEQANERGWKLVENVPPSVPTNCYAVAVGWAETNRIYRVYEVRQVPQVPRKIYKYDLSTACIEYGEITNLVTLVSADAGVKWMWDAAEILNESDPYFVAATNQVIASGMIDAAKVKAILDRAYELSRETEASK